VSRPYTNCDIEQLEAEFREHKDHLSVVRMLRAELAHRTTRRADRLRKKIDDRLRTLTAAESTSAAVSLARRVPSTAVTADRSAANQTQPLDDRMADGDRQDAVSPDSPTISWFGTRPSYVRTFDEEWSRVEERQRREHGRSVPPSAG
jgi:hypothetical protein